MQSQARKILLTGGTGKLGRRLLPALLQQGIPVRLLTPDAPPEHPLLEWQQMDFITDLSFDKAVDGCDVVLHLAAELWDTTRMEHVNGLATQALVAAAEKSGVKVFCYVSSVCVYGSPKGSLVTEQSPLISPVRGEHEDFYAPFYLQEYGRTKLLGELAVHSLASSTKYVIIRPTNIFSHHDILPILEWSLFTRIWRGYRVTHHVFIDDVVAAIIYLTEQALVQQNDGGRVNTFIVSEDDNPKNNFKAIFDIIFRKNKSIRYFCPRMSGPALDALKDVVKFRSFDARYPVGATRYSACKLLNYGFRYKVGISTAHTRAIDGIRTAPRKR